MIETQELFFSGEGNVRTDFRGRSYLIIGGARGIGAAIAREIARSGGNAAWTYLNNAADQDGTRKLQDEFKDLNIKHSAKALDCTDVPGTAQFCDELVQKWKRISGLVFCAGYTTPRPFLEIAPEEWRKLIDINLNGAFYAARAIIPHFKASGGGVIALIGSAAIVSGGGGRADYVSAKAGMEGLNRALAKDFAPFDIRCNIVHPSLIETDLLIERHPDPEKRAQLAREVPLRRLGKADDIAHAVVFLLSDYAGYITGQSLYVDGGRTFCR
jgi:3-oxoacyl-[acyl-carrier protein] reductase